MVFFYDSHVFIGGKEYPIGQCGIDVVNLEKAVLSELDQRVNTFIPAALALLEEKTNIAAALAQEKLNVVWDIVFSLLTYRDLKMDEECNYHAFQRLVVDKEKWVQVQDPASEGYAMYQGLLASLVCFVDNPQSFCKQIAGTAERYLEPLGRRNCDAYADAYSHLYTTMIRISARLGEDFDQSFPMQVDFVPMMHPNEKDRFFIAGKATFNSLTDFLWTEFYRGLAMGNAPLPQLREIFSADGRIQYLLLQSIAPGETVQNCRKVGARRKEAQGKANRTPAQKEYDRTYNRLKVRKQRGKISTDEWNITVTRTRESVTRSERGELTDEMLKQKLGEL